MLEDCKQSPYDLIYSIEPIELERLKAYIKTNLANSFIKLFKSLAGAPIFFHRKPNRSFSFFVDYCGLNNLTIKNQYLLSLIGELLNCLGRVE